MKRWIVVLSLVVGTACGGGRTTSPVGPSLTPASGAFVLTGTISGLVDTGSAPLPGATVSASGDGYASTESDGNGRFRLEGLSPGTWTVTVTHVGFEAVQTSVTLGGDMSADFALSPLVGPGEHHPSFPNVARAR